MNHIQFIVSGFRRHKHFGQRVEKHLEKPTILIVDDDFINKEILAHALEDDYLILMANSGTEALQIAEQELPDTILLDIVMPEIDGYEVCETLRRNKNTQMIPIIFSTSKTSTEEEVLGLNLGASDYITKPYNLPLVKARVRNQVLLKQKTDMLERLANIDALTKIPNRRCFDEVFDQEWRRAIRSRYPISIAMFDIDFFKQFNDHYGHVLGDDCLIRVARELSAQNRRAGDVVARYGGEEFAFVWPHCPLEKALVLAERALKAVTKLAIPHAGSAIKEVVTLSGGVATITPNLRVERISLLELADSQLYQAKQEGRARILGKILTFDD